MPSWEEIINQVTIPGDGDRIRDARGHWEAVFRRIRDARRHLDDGLADLASWQGDAGTAYRAAIGRIAGALDRLDDDNNRVVVQLDVAAQAMDRAVKAVPVPAELAHLVLEAKQNFVDDGRQLAGLAPNFIYDWTYAYLSAGGGQRPGGLTSAGPDSNWGRPADRSLDTLGEPAEPGRAGDLRRTGELRTRLIEWIRVQTENAQDVYQRLADEYTAVADQLPETPSTPPGPQVAAKGVDPPGAVTAYGEDRTPVDPYDPAAYGWEPYPPDADDMSGGAAPLGTGHLILPFAPMSGATAVGPLTSVFDPTPGPTTPGGLDNSVAATTWPADPWRRATTWGEDPWGGDGDTAPPLLG